MLAIESNLTDRGSAGNVNTRVANRRPPRRLRPGTGRPARWQVADAADRVVRGDRPGTRPVGGSGSGGERRGATRAVGDGARGAARTPRAAHPERWRGRVRV